MPRFVAIGEIMVELSPAAQGLMRMGFAGDTFNTAWYARKLLPSEWSVDYATCLGADALSGDVAGFIASHGIGTGTIRQHPDRTVGLYMIQLKDGERSFSYWRGQSAARTLADDPDWLDTVLAGADLAYLSGITLAILPAAKREVLCSALARARAAGTHVAFDTNLRLRLWEDVATARAGLRQGASVANTILPSFDEEQELFGDATPDETIARYSACGAQRIIVKNGASHVTFWDQGKRGTVQTTPVTPVDSTAAGDSFAAGVLAGVLSGLPLAQAAEQGARLAGRVVLGKGALVADALRTD